MLTAARLMTEPDEENTPECLKRDNLTSPYFPNTSTGGFAAICALCAIFLFTSLNRLNHTDLWGHLSFGRWIVEHGTLPTTDPFAAEQQITPVLPYCWLSQVLGYEVWRLGGNDGLILAHAVLETLAAGLIMLAVWRRGAKGFWPAVAGLAFVILSLPILGTIRPQLFAQVGMAFVLLACAELPRYRHPIFWLPFVFALWVNLHATIILGIGVLGIMTAGEIWRAWQEKADSQAILGNGSVQRHLLAILVCVLASCLNPHGPLMFIEALTFGRTGTVNAVSEWQPMTLTSMTGGLLVASAVLAFFVGVSIKEKQSLRWHEFALLFVLGLATFGAIRMLVWWAILWPWVVIPLAAVLFSKKGDSETSPAEIAESPTSDATSMRTVMAMGVVFVTLISAPPTHSLLHAKDRGDAKTMSTGTPIHVADEIARRKLAGTFVAPTDWADYVLWKSHERMKPFVYGHFHLATPADLADYRRILSGDDWLALARKHQLQFILADRERNRDPLKGPVLIKALNVSPDVRIIYQDKTCVLAEVLPPKESAAKSDEQPAASSASE